MYVYYLRYVTGYAEIYSFLFDYQQKMFAHSEDKQKFQRTNEIIMNISPYLNLPYIYCCTHVI